MIKKTFLLLLAASFLALAMTGCEKKEEAAADKKEEKAAAATAESVCKHMEEVTGEKDDSGECAKMIGELSKACGDKGQAMLDCLNTAAKESDAEACMQPCMEAMMGGAAPEGAEEAAPAEGEAAPAEGEAAPAEGEEAAPAEGEAAPAEGEAAPAEGEAAPAEGEAAPAE